MIQVRTYNGLPITGIQLRNDYSSFSAPDMKVNRMVEKGDYIRLRRDLYVDTHSGPIDTFLMANYMLSPSYVSGLSALSYYGIIPEMVYETISMTTRKSVKYDNPLGRFSYHLCDKDYFNIGIESHHEYGHSFLIAGKEKALCDTVQMIRNLNLRYIKETVIWLEDDMRMDMEILSGMNLDILRRCAETGKKSTIINNIIKIFS